MQIQFPYECPRCGARGELSIDAMARDERGSGAEAARRDLRWLRPVLRCPDCGKRPRAGMARVVARVVVPGALLAASSFYFGHSHIFDAMWAPVVFIWLLLGQLGRVRRVGRITTIRLAAACPSPQLHPRDVPGRKLLHDGRIGAEPSMEA
jgi:DNA-directed RNA polymerase subunit RPC12/RpoP